jgi:hypothetical protein
MDCSHYRGRLIIRRSVVTGREKGCSGFGDFVGDRPRGSPPSGRRAALCSVAQHGRGRKKKYSGPLDTHVPTSTQLQGVQPWGTPQKTQTRRKALHPDAATHSLIVFLFFHEERTNEQNRFCSYIFNLWCGQTNKKSAVSDFCPFVRVIL